MGIYGDFNFIAVDCRLVSSPQFYSLPEMDFHFTYCSIFMSIYGDFNFIAVDCRPVACLTLLIVRDGDLCLLKIL